MPPLGMPSIGNARRAIVAEGVMIYGRPSRGLGSIMGGKNTWNQGPTGLGKRWEVHEKANLGSRDDAVSFIFFYTQYLS